MKKEGKIKKELKTIIILTCILVFIVTIVFLIPVFSANKLADAFDAEGISYEMINNKKLNSIYVNVSENDKEDKRFVSPCEEAEIELRKSYDLENVDFYLTNCGTFNLIDINNNAAGESELILGQFYRFQQGSNEVYSAIANYFNKEETIFKCVAIRKGKYVFIILGKVIPPSMENVLKKLPGTREQTIDE